MLFLNPEKDRLVALRKTELQGELYDTVAYGHQTVSYLRPFLFSLQPQRNHPNAAASENLGRVLTLYDNAGEHFLPGQDTSASPVTRHLARSRCLFFLFDPTQDQRFRDLCQRTGSDPQMKQSIRTSRQESVLHEAAARVRRFTGLSQHAKHNRPLIVILTKSDAWAHLLTEAEKTEPWRMVARQGLAGLDLDVVEKQSRRARKLLRHVCPEVVAAAEGFSNSVTYIPVSALGRSPEQDDRTGLLGIRPRAIRPNWVTVPFLYALWRAAPGLIGVRRASKQRESGNSDDGHSPSGRLVKRDTGPGTGEHGR